MATVRLPSELLTSTSTPVAPARGSAATSPRLDNLYTTKCSPAAPVRFGETRDIGRVWHEVLCCACKLIPIYSRLRQCHWIPATRVKLVLMSVPEFYRFFRPCLELLISNGPMHSGDLAKAIAEKFDLSQADKEELIPSGKRTRVVDRTLWATTYLSQAKLLSRPKRGWSEITSRGRTFLAGAGDVIKPEELEIFPEYVEFKSRSRQKPTSQPIGITASVFTDSSSPEESIALAHKEVNLQLAQDLLDQIKGMSPVFFENLIVKLMLRLGYGGSVEDAGQTLGKSGDGGIDGVIKQDRFGLDNIYLKAKRWTDGTVGRKEIQAFVGALAGHGANKGVFITTSTFTKEAVEYAKTLHSAKLSLVDGIQLANLMIDSDLGVALSARYDVKRIDSDFFNEV